jgi:hypothetical protein
MKKILWVLGGLIVVLMIAGFIYRDQLMLTIFRESVKPATTFVETTPPAAPDYFDRDHWSALPDREDGADFTPADVTDGQAQARVDVFLFTRQPI